MFRLRKYLIVIPALIFILACQVFSRPLQQAQDVAGTAAAIATQGGQLVTQVSGYVTNIPPMETFVSIPTGIPGLPGSILEPKSSPLSEWMGIPIMPQASVGDESEGVYTYRVDATSDEIQEYYKAALPALGWESSFSMPVAETAILIYTKGEQVLSITIMPSEGGGMLVMLGLA